MLRTGRGSPVNGLCYGQDSNGERHSDSPLLADDQQPFTTMGFMNGAGSLLKVRTTRTDFRHSSCAENCPCSPGGFLLLCWIIMPRSPHGFPQ